MKYAKRFQALSFFAEHFQTLHSKIGRSRTNKTPLPLLPFVKVRHTIQSEKSLMETLTI